MIESITWTINGTTTGNLPSSQVQVILLFNPIFGIGILEFINLELLYNMSRIRCHATSDSQTSVSSEVTMLLLQGLSVVKQFYF